MIVDMAWHTQVLWACSVFAQLLLCGLLFQKGHFRKLPQFTTYVIFNLVQALTYYFVYSRFGFNSHTVFFFAWTFYGVSIAVRAFAITEICHLALNGYPGIWKFVQQASSAIFAIIVFIGTIVAVIDGIKTPAKSLSWIFSFADYGINLALAVGTLACVLLSGSYYIDIHRSYKKLIWGFGLYCCGVSLAEAVIKLISFLPFAVYDSIRQAIMLASYIYVIILWIRTLRNPLPPIAEDTPLVVRPPVPQTERIRYQLRGFTSAFARMILPEAQQ